MCKIIIISNTPTVSPTRVVRIQLVHAAHTHTHTRTLRRGETWEGTIFAIVLLSLLFNAWAFERWRAAQKHTHSNTRIVRRCLGYECVLLIKAMSVTVDCRGHGHIDSHTPFHFCSFYRFVFSFFFCTTFYFTSISDKPGAKKRK